jgi:hypothetical protein
MGESSATSEYVETDVTIMDSDTGSDDPGQSGSDEPNGDSGNGDNGNGGEKPGTKFPMGPKQGS